MEITKYLKNLQKASPDIIKLEVREKDDDYMIDLFQSIGNTFIEGKKVVNDIYLVTVGDTDGED